MFRGKDIVKYLNLKEINSGKKYNGMDIMIYPLSFDYLRQEKFDDGDFKGISSIMSGVFISTTLTLNDGYNSKHVYAVIYDDDLSIDEETKAFFIGHEIGHIMNGDYENKSYELLDGFINSSAAEYAADKFSIQSGNNPKGFMKGLYKIGQDMAVSILETDNPIVKFLTGCLCCTMNIKRCIKAKRLYSSLQ